jgi:3-isopropylmalate/(R)-2-methylmalate dehydratase large subunit
MPATLFRKVWDAHEVRRLPSGQTQIYIGLHLVHEVTSPQAFDMLRARGWSVRAVDRTFATVDHIVPTADPRRPFADTMAEAMMAALERNSAAVDIRLFNLGSDEQGPTARSARSRSGSAPRRCVTCSLRSAWPSIR